MEALNRPKLSDMVCESLIQYILNESLKPGDKLVMTHLPNATDGLRAEAVGGE